MPEKKNSIWSYATPTGSIKRAFSSVVKAKAALKNTAEVMRERFPSQASTAHYPEGDIRNIQDSRARFDAMYELHGWTEPELRKQLKALKRTKVTALVMGLVSVAAVVLLAMLAPRWVSMLLIPLSGSILVLGMGQAFKYALYEAQIDLHEFISAREFVEREDFWMRFFG